MDHPNKFAAPCRACGQLVAAGAGTVTRDKSGWVTAHTACPDTNPAPAARIPDGAYVNKYPGPCSACQQTVQPGQGYRTRQDDGWLMRHLTCPGDSAEAATPVGSTFTPTAEQLDILALFATGDHLVVEAGAGAGKALRDDEPVLTSDGWRAIGTLKVGDQVIGSDGLPHLVTGVFPQGIRPLFEVETSDGVVITADADHLWTTETSSDREHRRGRWTARTTAEIAATLTTRGGTRVNHYLPMLSAPVAGSSDVEWPLDPWLVGMLIGDGSLHGTVSISNPDPLVLAQVRRVLPANARLEPLDAVGKDWRIASSERVRAGHRGFWNPVTEALNEMGMWNVRSPEKTMPSSWRSLAADHRLALLQGLMDSDGFADGTTVEWSTTSPKLADQFVELIQSLGGTATTKMVETHYTKNGRRFDCQPAYRIWPRLPVGMAPFAHSTKLGRWTPRSKYPPRRQIVDVRPVAPGLATCISVDSHDSLYVVTGCVLTHNTSTLVLLAEAARVRGLSVQYTAFNSSLVKDARGRFPSNTAVSTMHALAFAAVGRHYKHRINGPRMRGDQIARILKVDPFIISYGSERIVLQPRRLGGLVLRSLQTFCRSTDLEPGPQHVGYVDGIDLPNADGSRTYDNNRQLARHLAPALRQAWADWCDPHGQLPYQPDGYLKKWAMSDPRIDADVVLYDECFPAGTMVETHLGPVPIEKIAECSEEPWRILSSPDGGRTLQWSRVGAAYRTPREGSLVRISGPFGNLTCTANHPLYVQDEGWVPAGLIRRGSHVRVVPNATSASGRQGVMLELMRPAAGALASRPGGRAATQGENLQAHEGRSDGDAQPDVEPGLGRQDGRDNAGTGAQTISPGRERDGADGAGGGSVRGVDGDLRTWALAPRLCRLEWSRSGEPRRTSPLQSRPGGTQHSDSGGGGWRVAQVAETSRVGQPQDGGAQWARVDSVEVHQCGGDGEPCGHSNSDHVYTLSVEETGCYFADGVLVKNCQDADPVQASIVMAQADHAQIVMVGDANQAIYSFRGCINAMAIMREQGARVGWLRTSFRFGQPIADVANGILGRLDAELRIVGTDRVRSELVELDEPDAVLCRTNAKAVTVVLEAQANGRRPFLVGGASDVAGFARGARELQNGIPTEHRDLACFESWNAVLEYVAMDEMGEDLRLLVRLVTDFGPDAIIAGLEGTAAEDKADLVVSTVHKAKGRQWPTVQLASDFRAPKDGGDLAADELRLLYVAVTRAQQLLDVSLAPIALGVPDEKPTADVVEPAGVEASAIDLTVRYGTATGR